MVTIDNKEYSLEYIRKAILLYQDLEEGKLEKEIVKELRK